ncbi:MAG TPA: hypothetical protein VF807_06295, partial [Ktedonobacterales bacterium]
MPRATSKFVCQQCGHESVKWMGRCPDCGQWNTLIETVTPATGSAARASARRGPHLAAVPLPAVRPLAEKRQSTGSAELDRVLGGGLVPGAVILMGGEPGIGKCVTGDTRVLDPQSGAFLPITELREKRAPVLSLDESSHRLVPQEVTAFYDQGVRPIVEVKTRLGRTLRCTPSHPVLTPDGWRAVGALEPGCRIAAPRSLPFFGTESLAEEAVKLIAYVLSDGCVRDVVGVTNTLVEVERDLHEIAAYFGMEIRAHQKTGTLAKSYVFTRRRAGREAIRNEVAEALRAVKAAHQPSWAAWARSAEV